VSGVLRLGIEASGAPGGGAGLGDARPIRGFALEGPPSPVVLVTEVGGASGAGAVAAALACAASEPDRAALLIELAAGRAPQPTPVASTSARELEERLVAHLPEAGVASRGHLCRLRLPADRDGVERISTALPLARETAAIVHLPPPLLRALLEEPRVGPTAALLRADLAADRALTALAARDLLARGMRVAVLKHRLGWVAARLALLGLRPAGNALPRRAVDRLLASTPSGHRPLPSTPAPEREGRAR
jgi:hypothetical protein